MTAADGEAISRRNDLREMRSDENDRFSRSTSAPMSAVLANRNLAFTDRKTSFAPDEGCVAREVCCLRLRSANINRAFAPRLGPNCDKFRLATVTEQAIRAITSLLRSSRLPVGRIGDRRELRPRRPRRSRRSNSLVEPVERRAPSFVIAPEAGFRAFLVARSHRAKRDCPLVLVHELRGRPFGQRQQAPADQVEAFDGEVGGDQRRCRRASTASRRDGPSGRRRPRRHAASRPRTWRMRDDGVADDRWSSACARRAVGRRRDVAAAPPTTSSDAAAAAAAQQRPPRSGAAAARPEPVLSSRRRHRLVEHRRKRCSERRAVALVARAQRLHVGMRVEPMLEIGAIVGRQLAIERQVDVVQRESRAGSFLDYLDHLAPRGVVEDRLADPPARSRSATSAFPRERRARSPLPHRKNLRPRPASARRAVPGLCCCSASRTSRDCDLVVLLRRRRLPADRLGHHRDDLAVALGCGEAGRRTDGA